MQLNKEQASLQRNGVIINNDDKFIHYLHKLYRSRRFKDETVIKWNNRPTAEQTYADAII